MRRTSIERYTADGRPVFDVRGWAIEVERMVHDRRQTIELALALLDHLARPGGPLEHVGGNVRCVASALDEYLMIPF